MGTIHVIVCLLVICSLHCKVRGDYDDCHCKPKIIKKYVLVEVPKYVPVHHTKKEDYLVYDKDDHYDRR